MIPRNIAIFLAMVAPAVAWAQSKTAEQAFKNIQILKGVPADQVFPTMQFISASLGVECQFCHVEGKFDSDEKRPKQTARKMIAMTMAINKDNFDGHRDVTCYSCHRGAEEPVGTPPVATADAMPEHEKEAESKPAALPTADEVLAKYIAAAGGAEAVHKMTSRVEDGTLNAFGQESPIQLFLKAPDKRMSISKTAKGESITAFDGKNGWLKSTGRPAREMEGAEVEAAKLDADFYFPTHVKQLFSRMRVRADGQDYVVTGTREGQPPVRMYFDKTTGMLTRLIRYSDTPVGRNPTQIDYADYRDVEGVKLPFRWTLARPGGRFTIQISKIEVNVPVEDSKFVKPEK